ncbi:MAG: FAD-dependent oxidoreductase [Nitriliruptorales bacterium]|nr:FAD-dependent oxidoreductase [Nitriliruptorales bacterium]
MADYDGIVIGGGHNALTCAAYLAKAGARIAVLERNDEVGGGTTTWEVTLPGFKHNMHANYFIGFDLAPVCTDLELDRYGFEYLLPKIQHACLYRDGRAIVIQRDLDKTCASIARFSARDADAFRCLYQRYAIDKRRFFAAHMYNPPPGPDGMRERFEAGELPELAEFAARTPYEVINRHFESEQVRVFFKKLLHIVHANDFVGTGFWFPLLIANVTSATLPVGGAGNLPKALAALVEDHGGTVRTSAHVRRIVVEHGTARGVELADGSTLTADFLVSGVDFPQTVQLAEPTNFDDDVAMKARNWRWTDEHSLMTMHLALENPPSYRAAEFDPDVDKAYNVQFGADDTNDLLIMLDEMRAGRFPSKPAGNGCTNSVFDPTYAPEGKHVSFWWPFASYELGGKSSVWDERRKEYEQTLLAVWRMYATNLGDDNVLQSYLYTPHDIPRYNISMVRGSVRLGAYNADQLGMNRPHPKLADYRGDTIQGLYHCGSGSANGGGVNGAPGYNAAGVIAADQGLDRWWSSFDFEDSS